MREFTDADREKKKRRIQLPENPGNLPPEALSRLEEAVRARAKEGLVPCPTAWRIAQEQGVSRLDVGVRIDKLGLRVSDCQLGCFQVGKTSRLGAAPHPSDPQLARRVEALYEKGELTCANVFALAGERGLAPRAVADAANARGYKLRQCQLGCF